MDQDLQIEILDGDAALDGLKSEWMDLSERARKHFCSQTFYWATHAWKHAARRGGCRLRILVGRDRGRLVLIWPLVIRRWLAWREADWLGAGYEYRDVLVERSPFAGQWIGAAWDVIKTGLGVDLVSCPSIRSDAAVFPILKQEASAALLYAPVLFIAVHRWPNWDSYQKSMRAKFCRDQRRRLRRLSELGHVAFEVVDGSEEVEALIGWLVTRKLAWARRKGLALLWLESEAYQSFLSGVAKDALRSGDLLLGTLKLNDQVLAALLAFVCGTRMELYLMAYDREWRSYGPGRLIFEEMVRWAFDKQLSVVDFRTGVEPFKYDFTSDETRRIDCFVPCSFWGTCYVTWRGSAIRSIIERCYRALPAGAQRALKAR